MVRYLPLALLGLILWVWPVAWTAWTDEAFTVGLASRDFAGTLHGVVQDRHTPAYFLLVSAWYAVTQTDGGLRLVSAAAVLLGWLATVDAARRHLRPAGALAAAAWFAAAAVPACFAHTLRPYALVLAAGAVLTWAALEGAAEERARARRGALAFAIGGLLAFWTHYAATLVGVAAFAAAAAGAWRRPEPARRLGAWGVAGAAVVVGCLPWLLGPFQTQFAERNPRGAMVWEVWAYLAFSPDPSVPWWGLVGAGFTAVGALAVLVTDAGSPGFRRAVVPFGACMLLLPWVASANVPARELRNYIGFFPMAALLVGAALDAATAPARRELLAAAAALAVALPPTVRMLATPFHPQDVSGGHDYRVEAEVLDRVIPAGATLRFQPDYVLHQFDRYAPGLARRAVLGPAEWTLSAAGGAPVGCVVIHAFRVKVYPPEADCDATWAALSAEADRTGYAGLRIARASRAIDRRELDVAAADLAVVLDQPQRWPAAATLAGRLAELRVDDRTALRAYEEALRLARAYDSPAGAIQSLWRKVARLRVQTGDDAGAAVATAAEACAAAREPAWACGGPLAWATRPAE